MPMLQINKVSGNESARSNSSRAGLNKPALGKQGGFAKRLAAFRPKLGLGSGS